MSGFSRFQLALAGIVFIGGCAKKPYQQYSNVHTGAEAWQVAEDATQPKASTASAVLSAKQICQQNISNAETTGYRAVVCRVVDGKVQTTWDMSQGRLESTGRQLDVAIEGPGFFRFAINPEHGDGYAYSRNGNFFVNNNGDLLLGAGDGYRLDPPINIPTNTTAITISQSGVILVQRAGLAQLQNIGQIQLFVFRSPENLKYFTPGVFESTQKSGEPIALKPSESNAGTLQQTFLERSNVDLLREQQRIDFLNRWFTAISSE